MNRYTTCITPIFRGYQCAFSTWNELESWTLDSQARYLYELHIGYPHLPIVALYTAGLPADFCSFPINVNLEKKDDRYEVEIRNFIGEKIVRRIMCRPGVDVEVSKTQKDELVLSGNVRCSGSKSQGLC